MKIRKSLLIIASSLSFLMACSNDEKPKEDKQEVEREQEQEVFGNGAVSKDENETLQNIAKKAQESKDVVEVKTEILSIDQIVKAEIIFKKDTAQKVKEEIIAETMKHLKETMPQYNANVITTEEKQ